MCDIICHRFLTLVSHCLSHKSSLIRRLAGNSILSNNVTSPIGRNLVYCARRYNFAVSDFLNGIIEPTHVIRLHNINSHSQARVTDVELLQELINLREGSLSFTDDPSFLSHDEIRDIIDYICSH